MSSKITDTAARTRGNLITSPHSWELKTWPQDVWPHTRPRAEWLLRAYRKELVAAGAISRIGKLLIVIGSAYTKWLATRANNVSEWTSNNPRIAEVGARNRGVSRPRKPTESAQTTEPASA